MSHPETSAVDSFNSRHRGRVEVCWATSGDNFSMSWTEREGRPCGPKRRGFGTTVME
jgi:two-component sensor histidine kinase